MILNSPLLKRIHNGHYKYWSVSAKVAACELIAFIFPLGPLLLGSRAANQSLYFPSLHLSECMCVHVYPCTRKQPSPSDSCSWINIVYFLIEQGEHWRPELSLLPQTHAQTCKYTDKCNITHLHKHTKKKHTQLSAFLAVNVYILHALDNKVWGFFFLLFNVAI